VPDATDLATYVINLRRRPDRREWMTAMLPSQLQATFTSDWEGRFDGQEISRADLAAIGYQLFPWRIESENPWWSRPLKLGEIGCTLAHLACWRHAAERRREPLILILEDDAVLAPNFLEVLLGGLRQLGQSEPIGFDLLYLGRYPLQPDRPAGPGFVAPGYSHCTFSYLVTRRALGILLETRLDQAIVPIDEFLPSLYVDHPRPDLRARFPRQLIALAFEPPLVHQLPKSEAGSDTEESDFADG
jgi:collagen beta-1,O-galactosyltransferase